LLPNTDDNQLHHHPGAVFQRISEIFKLYVPVSPFPVLIFGLEYQELFKILWLFPAVAWNCVQYEKLPFLTPEYVKHGPWLCFSQSDFALLVSVQCIVRAFLAWTGFDGENSRRAKVCRPPSYSAKI
jgi:hypothetical protein